MRSSSVVVIVARITFAVLFALQNLQSVTVSFLTLKMSAPLAVLVVLVNTLGMMTGGSALSLVRQAINEKSPS